MKLNASESIDMIRMLGGQRNALLEQIKIAAQLEKEAIERGIPSVLMADRLTYNTEIYLIKALEEVNKAMIVLLRKMRSDVTLSDVPLSGVTLSVGTTTEKEEQVPAMEKTKCDTCCDCIHAAYDSQGNVWKNSNGTRIWCFDCMDMKELDVGCIAFCETFK